MRFDGYGATIRTETPREIVACLADALNTKPEAGPAVRRFGVTTGFNVGPRLAVWMGIDPNPETDICYIEAKGETTPQVVEAIRRSFPVHSARAMKFWAPWPAMAPCGPTANSPSTR